MDPFLAITQGLGLSLAAGMRSFLPPLLVGALAHNDVGIDFDGTSYDFIEAEWFLLLLLGINAVAFVLERRGVVPLGTPREASASTRLVHLLFGLVHASLGAILFAASLAERDQTAWPGLVAGALAALLAFVVIGDVLAGASRRAEGSRLLGLYSDGASLVLVLACVAFPPVSILAALALLWLLLARRRRAARKYEGLRVLR